VAWGVKGEQGRKERGRLTRRRESREWAERLLVAAVIESSVPMLTLCTLGGRFSSKP
jgi:hypothetical protein